jgi:hypothetical protein
MGNLPMLANKPPEEVYYRCELPGCGKITHDSQTYSLAVGYRMPGAGLPAFQCEGTQHFACCPEHALEVVLLCLVSHILPAHEQQHQGEGLPPVADRALLMQHMLQWLQAVQSKGTDGSA